MNIRIALALLALSFAGNIAFVAMSPSWWVIPAALFGWYLADTMSGLVHMYMDYRPCRPGIGLDKLFFYQESRESDHYIQLRNRVLGQLNPFERLVFDFKNHHPRPDALGRRDMVTQIGATVAFGSLPFSILLNLACLVFPVPGWLIAMAVAFLIGGTFSQYFHGTLHRSDNPWPVHILRKVGLLMAPEGHHRHHETLRYDFSTINGWSNPVLNVFFHQLRKRGYMPDDGLVPG